MPSTLLASPLTSPNRFSAGVVVIREADNGCLFLLLRAYRYWDFPKGEVFEDEDPLDAAVRETAEETGITDLTFPWGRDWYQTPPYGKGKVARYYVGRTRTTEPVLPVSPELGAPEHHEYRWCTRTEARALLGDRVAAALNWAAEYSGCREREQ